MVFQFLYTITSCDISQNGNVVKSNVTLFSAQQKTKTFCVFPLLNFPYFVPCFARQRGKINKQRAAEAANPLRPRVFRTQGWRTSFCLFSPQGALQSCFARRSRENLAKGGTAENQAAPSSLWPFCKTKVRPLLCLFSLRSRENLAKRSCYTTSPLLLGYRFAASAAFSLQSKKVRLAKRLCKAKRSCEPTSPSEETLQGKGEKSEKLKYKPNYRLGMKKRYNIRRSMVRQDIFADDRTNLHDNNSYIKISRSVNLNKYYLGNRNNTLIFDRKFLFSYLTTALYVFIHVLRMNGNILIINTNPELSKLIYHVKKNIHNHNFKLFKNNIFFSDCGWTNGTLTNSTKVFNKVKTFIDFYINYNTFLNENNIIFPAYTKMKKNYKGFIPTTSYNKDFSSNLHTSALNPNLKPDLIVFLSITNCKSIIKEANSLNIPIMGFVDINSPIDDIQYPIFGNTNFYSLIWFFFTLITKITNYSNSNYNVK